MQNPSLALGHPSTLASLLDEGLKARADEPAILDLDETHSFRDLQRQAQTIAAFLSQEHQVVESDRVVVAVVKSPLIVSIALACWMIGAVYVPVDPESPRHRTTTILESIRPAIVIGPQELLSSWTDRLDSNARASYELLLSLATPDAPAAPCALDGQAPAVIIHTSGSTGIPKGVVLSHASVLAYMRNHNEFLKFDHSGVSMNNSPFFFDVSIQDTFLPLFFGATVLFHRGLWASPIMIGLIQRYRVTHLIAVSSILKLISSDTRRMRTLATSSLRVVITGAEVCPPRLINFWLETIPGLRVLYGYGPTEVNSLCTTHEITQPEPGRTDIYPIGKPFRGHQAILLDEERKVINGAGVVGTLAVGGPQVMIGYWKDPELTARVTFVHEGVRYYITGDRCHRDIDGNYVFDGRLDTEVKIRGRRINLNEIRNALVVRTDMEHAVVSVIQVGDESRIVACVHITYPDPEHGQILRRWLADRVPEYMVPWYIAVFSQPPRTATDKLDERWMLETLQSFVVAQPGQRDFKVEPQDSI